MRSDWDKVAADARRVLAGNRQRGISAWAGQRYDFVCPSPTTYPFQWFWDSGFHAIALLHVDPELAKQMEVAESVMRKRRTLLRKLAAS